ncbi:M20/M25/M40 family metallo-hydrolase [Bythopirellula polymerisocia]|uniref:Peptidase T n=1 Tax=Bythopirellula polymerisocia TaxID=2528003 RepID=A0A5C6D255_9BACT|nr:M20/M25/M40 family metallo-hydrolase [Bythopirellula polymerisocia]TWU29296.1 Peptidase T [Bythopirellula polymerisocia]
MKSNSEILPVSTDRVAEQLLLDLLALPGSSGHEVAVAEFICERLRAAGLPKKDLKFDQANRKSILKGETGNLVLRLPGTMRGPRRLLVAHLDTVPICQGTRPAKRGRRIVSLDKHTGLGGDDRAGVAVLLATALNIIEKKLPHPPITFLWTVQEETGLNGARHATLSLLGKPTLAFNFDGNSPARLTIGATGGYRMNIEIRGLASHAGGHPEQGVSAIAIASLAIADLVKNGWHGLVEKNRQRGTSNVGVIHGGAATNVVTDLVQIRAEARGHDPKFRQRIIDEIEQAFHRAAKEVTNTNGQCGTVSIAGRLDYEAFCLAKDCPSILAAKAAVEAEGCSPEFNISNGGLDANWLTARGIPTVTLGCGQNEIHTVSEWLDLEEFHRALRIALRLATET